MFSKRTKIICTIGPASNTLEKLMTLTEAGMNVCRLNFSHGTHDEHALVIQRIREVKKKTGEPLAILQDLQGPKIRVGELPKEGVTLEHGKDVIFTTGKAEIPKKLPVTYMELHKDVKAGQTILLDDGLLMVKVKSVKGKDDLCDVIHGGLLTSHKGMNLPETKTSISAVSDKDRDDLRFGVEQGVDWVALSFVRSADDLRELRKMIEADEKALGMKPDAPIRIIAKIEKPEAITNIDEIIEEADGIMVARGDLGIEIPAAKVPLYQKEIIAKCLKAAKPVIVATQMLDSMIRNPRATRAEISDIANAVIDHADATMLSGETANGAYPVEAVQTMAATIEEVEASRFDDIPLQVQMGQDPQVSMTNVANVLAHASKAKAISVSSLSGQAARLVSRYRPKLPIFVGTPHDRVRAQLNLSWGVYPFRVPVCKTIVELLKTSVDYLTREEYVEAGDEIIIVAGEPLGQSGFINLVELRKV